MRSRIARVVLPTFLRLTQRHPANQGSSVLGLASQIGPAVTGVGPSSLARMAQLTGQTSHRLHFPHGRPLSSFTCSRSVQRKQGLPARATSVSSAPSSAASGSKETDFQQAFAILKLAAEKRTPPPKLVLEAMLKMEQQKLADDSYANIIGGDNDDGRNWELIFISGSNDVQKAKKGQPAGGSYNPIPAAQRWIKKTGTVENGVFLGAILAFVFQGPYEYSKNKLTFDFNKLKVRLGPKWFDINLGSMEKFQGKSKGKPFYLFAYAGDEFVVARGKGGGLGLWARAKPAWELQNSVGVY